MAGTLTVGSSFPAALNIALPPKDAKKDDPAPDPIWINGAIGSREGITTGVEAKVFRSWLKANPDHPAVLGGLLRELPGGIETLEPDDETGPVIEAPVVSAAPASGATPRTATK